ncbi:MAG: GNAT family N-acetyltransferase [Bdellovibrionales bacterium]
MQNASTEKVNTTTCILERYETETASIETTDSLIDCYRSVFAAEPWGEWMKCPKCGFYWGLEDKETLAKDGFSHCGEKLVEFWPRDQVKADIQNEISQDASCWIAKDNGNVIGFSWAYPISLAKLENKLEISINAENLRNSSQTVAYLDEVGVSPEYRKQNLATTLKSLVLQDMFQKGARAVIGRVRKEPTPSVTYLWWTQKLGYNVVGSYPYQDGRVVLARTMSLAPRTERGPMYG